MGLSKLEWLVVRDFAMSETANFWQKGRLVQRGELAPEQIETEMFFLPAALVAEKDGSVTNTTRLVQWHDTVCEAPGDSRSDLWFIYHLGKRLKQLYADSTDAKDRAIQDLTWTYPERGERHEPEAAAVLREINGYTVADRKQVAKYQDLKDDGSTACGWMDVLRHLSEGRAQRGALAQAGRSARSGRSFRVGLRMAVQPADPIQSRIGRPGGQAMVRGEENGPGGTRKPASGPGPIYRTSCRIGGRTTDRTGARSHTAWTPMVVNLPFIMEADGYCQLFVAVGAQGRPASLALRAGGKARSATCSTGNSIIPRPTFGSGLATSCMLWAMRAFPTCSRPTGSPNCIAAA